MGRHVYHEGDCWIREIAL